VIVDDFTRYTWVFFLVDKSDVFATFKSFVKRIHNKFETTIKKVRSDNGSEFKNTRIDELCDEFGIRHQFSAKYTLQSNVLVERKNIILIDMARSMLSEYNVSHSFWAEAINTTCYYNNRLYCHPMMEKTPYDLLNGRKPIIAYFRVFDCKCYILKKGTRLSKFEKKCDEGFLLLARPIEFGIWQVVLLRNFMMWNVLHSSERSSSSVDLENFKSISSLSSPSLSLVLIHERIWGKP
jgi:hypothetical protein